MNVLVDTSVWSLAFRRRRHQLNESEKAIVEELLEIINENRARMIGLVRQELLTGIRDASQFEALRLKLREFPDEDITEEDHEAAAQAANQCKTKGIAVFIVDILIYAVAARRGWAVFSLDPDFGLYARILPIHLHVCRS